jgi:hypothetical protein
MHAVRLGAALVATAVLALAAAPAEAQRRQGWGSGAYDEGYRDGARAGADDARDGRGFEYQRHRDYRSADGGYDRRDGRREAYAQEYRGGFVAGYRDAYYARGGRGPGVVGRDRAPGYDPRYDPRGRGAGRGARGGVSDDIGYSNGFEEGFKRGLEDGRDRDRYDPRRHGRYRDADQGYRREYGPKNIYEASYRQGFERGYEQGYRDTQRRRGGIWPW